MKEEIWRDIPNYEGIYMISNNGNVKSLKFNKTKILKKIINSGGYYFVNLSNGEKMEMKTIHHLMAVSFLNHKPCGHKLVIDHINTNKLDNNLENLQIVDQRKNLSKDQRGTSKYTGVYLNKTSKKWISKIKIKGKDNYIGSFEDEYEAHLAYQKKLKEINDGKY